MPEIVEYIRNEEKWTKVTQTAYEEIALNPKYHYRSMIEQLDQVVNEEYQRSFWDAELLKGKFFSCFNKFRLHHRMYYRGL
jgi:hypothetical protein